MVIKKIKFLLYGIIILSSIVIVSCGKTVDNNSASDPVITGTGGTEEGSGNANKILSFSASGSPINNSVYLEQVAIDNDQITLSIKVKGGADVYGAVMEITYDPGKIKYVSSVNGDYLGGTADTFFYTFLVNGQEGRLHMAIDKKAVVSGAYGDGILATIVLKALTGQAGTLIDFDKTISNLMPSNSNTPIPGTSLLGGTLSYQ